MRNLTATSQLFLLAAVAGAGSLCFDHVARADIIVPTDLFPPQGTYVFGSDMTYSGPFPTRVLHNVLLFNFAPQAATPALGFTSVLSFTGTMTFDMSIGGGAFSPFTASVACSVFLNHNTDIGSLRHFNTEMLQLDVSGGTLPGGMRLRESPTLASTGQTTIEPSGGNFHIDSFFDVFTELSIDDGQTWVPTQGGSTHSNVSPTPGTLALLAAGLLGARRRRRAA